MNREYIENHQIVERYLQGRLTPAEEEAFEEYYLSHPEIVEELEVTERLQDGIRHLDAARQLVRHNQPERPWWLRARVSPIFAAAASLLLAVSLVLTGGLYLQNSAFRQELQTIAGIERPRLVPVLAVRGTEVNTIAQPAEGEWTVLLLDAGFTEYTSYAVTVSRPEQPAPVELWVQRDLMPGYEDLLAVGLPGHLLQPGDYDIRVTGRMDDWSRERADEEITRMSFRVVPTGIDR